MKERSGIYISQKEKDDATLNSVSRQAQEAILDPHLPESLKDDILNAAVGTILKIAERRGGYKVRRRKNGGLKQTHTIYKAK